MTNAKPPPPKTPPPLRNRARTFAGEGILEEGGQPKKGAPKGKKAAKGQPSRAEEGSQG